MVGVIVGTVRVVTGGSVTVSGGTANAADTKQRLLLRSKGMFALRVPKSLARWQHGMLWTQRAGRAGDNTAGGDGLATAADAPRTETAFHVFFRFIILLK